MAHKSRAPNHLPPPPPPAFVETTLTRNTPPRKIAEHTSLAAPAHKTTIIDLFAGVGGNAIAFALSGRWDRVFAVERDPDALRCARHNAEIYGVARRIWWVEGDCFKMLGARFRGMGREAVVFASPPWGGTFVLWSFYFLLLLRGEGHR